MRRNVGNICPKNLPRASCYPRFPRALSQRTMFLSHFSLLKTHFISPLVPGQSPSRAVGSTSWLPPTHGNKEKRRVTRLVRLWSEDFQQGISAPARWFASLVMQLWSVKWAQACPPCAPTNVPLGAPLRAAGSTHLGTWNYIMYKYRLGFYNSLEVAHFHAIILCSFFHIVDCLLWFLLLSSQRQHPECWWQETWHSPRL